MNVYITMEHHHAINGKTHYFDWAIFHSFLLVYQRVPVAYHGIIRDPGPCRQHGGDTDLLYTYSGWHRDKSSWHTMGFMSIFIWLVVYLALWKMMEFVSWDDEIPNWMEIIGNICWHRYFIPPKICKSAFPNTCLKQFGMAAANNAELPRWASWD